MAGLEHFNDWELLHNSDSEPVLVDSATPVSNSPDSSPDSLGESSRAELVVGSPEVGEFEGKQGIRDGVVGEEIRRNQDVGFEEEVKTDVGFEGIGVLSGVEEVGEGKAGERVESSAAEVVAGSSGFVEFNGKQSCGGSDGVVVEEIRGSQYIGFEEEVKENVGFEGIGVLSGVEEVGECEVVESSGGGGGGESEGDVGEVKEEEEESRGIVWWKLPFEILKFCVFRVNPVLSLSVAAAVLGFVILRKRLNRMKRKSRNIPITLAVEEKKASQLRMHATRLNEAFSVVKSVPVVRARLLPAGVTPWPTLNLR